MCGGFGANEVVRLKPFSARLDFTDYTIDVRCTDESHREYRKTQACSQGLEDQIVHVDRLGPGSPNGYRKQQGIKTTSAARKAG